MEKIRDTATAAGAVLLPPSSVLATMTILNQVEAGIRIFTLIVGALGGLVLLALYVTKWQREEIKRCQDCIDQTPGGARPGWCFVPKRHRPLKCPKNRKAIFWNRGGHR